MHIDNKYAIDYSSDKFPKYHFPEGWSKNPKPF